MRRAEIAGAFMIDVPSWYPLIPLPRTATLFRLLSRSAKGYPARDDGFLGSLFADRSLLHAEAPVGAATSSTDRRRAIDHRDPSTCPTHPIQPRCGLRM